ncbi:MobA/MobL family protein [Massilia oculi]|uniref:MobA/MobL family protein n=1 Tax=Massilia oculi TaxID=945844 RepID=UPI001AAFCCD4|nr:MobA/MobL family protein [Massilia oculi]
MKHAQYVAGEGRQADRDDVMYSEDGNLPKWAGNAVEFFKAADQFERGSHTRKDKTKDSLVEYESTRSGRSYKELEVAIPREAKDPVQWAKDFVRELVGDKHPYRMGVHDKKAQDGGRNPHLHMMFSTRTMDGYDRTKEQFFKRANSGTYKVRGETRHHKPGSGGAKKSEFWNSREAVPHTRSLFERHVQRAAPEFKLKRSEAPEPKIGPELKYAPQKYEEDREKRVVDVYELRSMKKKRAELDKEIEKEELLREAWTRSSSSTDALLVQIPPKAGQEREPAGRPDWSQFVSVAGSRGAQDRKESAVKPDWSKFVNVAGSRGTADDEGKGKPMTMMKPQLGPQYFPQTKEKEERNRDEAGALHQIEQQRKKQQVQEKDREKDSGLDFNM